MLSVITTLPTQEAADTLARALLDQRLAACVQVSGPIRSHYVWQGQRECSEEWVCTIKTFPSHYDQLETAVVAAHPYDVPQILALPVQRAYEPYRQWAQDQLHDLEDGSGGS